MVRIVRESGARLAGVARALTAPVSASLAGKFSVVLAALLIPLISVGLIVARGLSSNADDLLRARRVKELAATSLSLIMTQDDVTKEILLDVERISEARRKIDAYDENLRVLDEIAALTRSPEMLETLGDLRRLDDEELRPMDSRVLEALTQSGAQAAQRIYFDAYRDVRLRYVNLSRRLMEQAEQHANEAEAELERRNQRSIQEIVAALLVGIGLVAAIAQAITGQVRRRLIAVVGVLEDVAGGDLRVRLVDPSRDEIGRMARALNRALESLGDAVEQADDSARQMQIGTQGIARAGDLLVKTAADQRREVERASDSMDQVTAQVWEIAETARNMRAAVESAAGVVGEISAMSDRFRENSSSLVDTVDTTSASVENMKIVVAQVDAATQVLAEGSDSTSKSMLAMAREMRAVDETATRSAQLWQRMVSRGEQALEKVQQTVEGVDAIRRATRDAEQVVRGVGRRADEIGAILDVINAVADETKLLALNAAIIAAQSGEGGRAFAVVAGQIKSLAQSVVSNTQEIENLIRAVQQESENAIAAIGRGAGSVDVVVDLSAEAGAAVDEITSSSRESGEQIRDIAEAVRDQTRAAERIVELMQETGEAISEIRTAVSRHGVSNDELAAAARVTQEAARRISETAIELVGCTDRIRESVESVKFASGDVEQSLQTQSRFTQTIAEFLEAVGRKAGENSQSALVTSNASKELTEQADALRERVQRFEL